MDSYTVFNHKLDKIFNGLSKNISFMNQKEWNLGSNMDHYIDFVKAFKDESIINENTEMWNSGMVAIHKENLHAIDKIIDLLKEFVKVKFSLFDHYLTVYPPEKYGGKPYDNHRTVEQLAISVVLNKLGYVRETWDLFYHYYEHKDKVHAYTNRFADIVRKLDPNDVLFDDRYESLFEWIRRFGEITRK